MKQAKVVEEEEQIELDVEEEVFERIRKDMEKERLMAGGILRYKRVKEVPNG